MIDVLWLNKTYLAKHSTLKGWKPRDIVKDGISRLLVKEMQHDEYFKNNCILKGSACFNICYLKDKFRLSDDLDFTILEKKLDQSLITEKLKKVCKSIEEKTEQKIKILSKLKNTTSDNYIKLEISYNIPHLSSKKCKFKITRVAFKEGY